MKKISFLSVLVVLVLFANHKAKAQYYFYDDSYYDNPVMFELGGSIGVMNCLTDLGGKAGIGKKFIKDLNYGQNQTVAGAYLNLLYKNAIGLRIEAAFGKVSADDADLASVPTTDIARTRFNRNLNFTSEIKEYSLVTELHPFFLFIDWESREDEPPKYSPYLLGGIGYFSFNPQGKSGK